MKAEFTRICAVVLGLVLCASAQDLSPAVFGAKPPLLLMFGCFAGVPAAICAGLFADALSGLPFGCSPAAFAVAAFAVRLSGPAGIFMAAVSAAAYQLWLVPWSEGGFSWVAIASAIVLAAVLAPLTSSALGLARRRIGIDRKGGAA